MSVNEMATQNVQRHLSQQPGKEGGAVGHRASEYVLQHFRNFMKMIDSSLPLVALIWIIIYRHFYIFHPKIIKGWFLINMS
jgi:hypothetical protein